MEDDMLGTILFFAITIYFWLRCRNKDRANGVRAFEDFEHKPDSASTLVAYLIFIALAYASIYGTLIVFYLLPIPGIVLLVPFVALGLFAASWAFTRRLGYIDLGGSRNIRFNRWWLDTRARFNDGVFKARG